MSLSDDQLKETLDAYKKFDGDRKAAAKYLGIPFSRFRDRYKIAIERIEYGVLEGNTLSKLSTLRDGEGKKVLEWTIQNKEHLQQIEAFKTAIAALQDGIPKTSPIKPPKTSLADLLSMYVITDYHIGMLAWWEEGGDNWDVTIAENMLVDWFYAAIKAAPDSHTAILCQLGDFLHYDSLTAVTPTSGHPLDADSRYQKMVEVAVRAVIRVINLLLDKHEHVHVLMAEGNHDIASSVWLRATMNVFFADEPRVTVDNTHTPFYAYEWGKTSLFFHHGHKVKMSAVSSAFAGIYRDIFGRTEYSYAHMGHMHHRDVKENQMMIVEQHPTLAANDSHGARGGYLSQRGASVISYSKEYGEVSRVTIRPEMIK